MLKHAPEKRKTAKVVTSDEKRLRAAGWRKVKTGWKSPYSGNVHSEEKAVTIEIIRRRD